MKGSLNLVLILAILGLSMRSVAAQTALQINPVEPSSTEKIVELNEPAVVLIYTHYQATFTFPRTQYTGPDDHGAYHFTPIVGFTSTPGKGQFNRTLSFTVDRGDFGSGFVFNPDGYIMTNAHVATSLMNKGNFMADLAANASRRYSITAKIGNQRLLNNYARDFRNFLFENGNFTNEQTEVIVLFGQYQNVTNNALDSLTTKGVEADVKALGMVGGKDVAVLKVNMEYKLPTVQFGDSNSISAHLGEQVVVIGYPAMTTGAPQSSGVKRWQILQGSGAGGTQESILPTATAGIASAVKTAVGPSGSTQGQFTYIQTDASIHPGNSGGPAFDPQGKTIGVATLGASDPNNPGAALSNIGFLIPINTASEFSDQINVKNVRGPIDTYWAQALNYFWASHYSAALEQFQKVQGLYPTHPYVARFISESQAAISRGEDITISRGEEGFSIVITRTYLYGLVGVLVAVILVIFLVRRRRAAALSSPPVTPV